MADGPHQHPGVNGFFTSYSGMTLGRAGAIDKAFFLPSL